MLLVTVSRSKREKLLLRDLRLLVLAELVVVHARRLHLVDESAVSVVLLSVLVDNPGAPTLVPANYRIILQAAAAVLLQAHAHLSGVSHGGRMLRTKSDRRQTGVLCNELQIGVQDRRAGDRAGVVARVMAAVWQRCHAQFTIAVHTIQGFDDRRRVLAIAATVAVAAYLGDDGVRYWRAVPKTKGHSEVLRIVPAATIGLGRARARRLQPHVASSGRRWTGPCAELSWTHLDSCLSQEARRQFGIEFTGHRHYW